MSLRTLIGLCEHRWQDTGQVNTQVANVWRTSLEEPAWLTTKIAVSQRCEKCGKVRSIQL